MLKQPPGYVIAVLVVIGNQVDPEQDDYPEDHAADGPGAGQDTLGSVIQKQRAKQCPQMPKKTEARLYMPVTEYLC